MPDLAHDLLLLITNLSQHKDKKSIKSLFSEGIQSLFPDYQFAWEEESGKTPGHLMFEIQTRNHLFGYLVVTSSDPPSQADQAMIQNAVQMVAIILERIHDQKELEDYKNNLEKLVESKTHDIVLREIKYRSLFESMPLGVVYHDATGKITSANPAAEHILGITLDQMQGRTSYDPRWHTIHEDGSPFPGDEHPSTVALSTGKEVVNALMGVFNPVLEDYTWININAVPRFRPEEKKPFEVVTTFDDVTIRKKHTETLLALSARQEAILLAVPDIIMEVDDQKTYTWANPAGLEFFGPDVIGKPADAYFEGEQDTYGLVQPLFNGHEDVIYVESWQRRKDGKKRLLAWWCRVLKNEKKEVVGALSSARDITENREVEIMLSERNQFIESLVNLQPNIIYIYDLVNHKNIYSNDGIQRILGYSVAEIQQMDSQIIKRLMHPDDWPVYLNEILPRYMNITDGEQIIHQYRMRHKTGGWRWLSSSEIIYRRATDGSPEQIFGVIHDISDRKNAEEEITRLNLSLEQRVIERTAELEMVNKELESFAYSISHDLRAPLRAIDGFSNIIKDIYSGILDDQGKRYLDVICRSAIKMDKLIMDLLDLSRISRREMRLSTVAVNELIESILHEITTPEERRLVTLEIPSLPDVSADPTLIRQVWINLLSNALKYTGKQQQRVIQVGFKEDSSDVITYWIKDNGVGFDNKFAEKIFGVFQRLHPDDEFEGTGVGLAIVDRIIKRHGGKVWAEGKPGEGATFYFCLPKSVSNF